MGELQEESMNVITDPKQAGESLKCLTALEEIQRLRAIEAAARAYCDLTPERADETPAPLLFAKLQAALAAKDAP
jgi:hypothetical protein